MTNAISVHLHEWEVRDPTDHGGGDVRGVELDDAEARRQAEQLSASGKLEILEVRRGLRIASTSFVGRIQLGSVVITVKPKIASEQLLALLRYAYGLSNLEPWSKTEFATGGQIFQDLIVAQFLAEARELLGRGLIRRYVEVAEDLASPRGRIDVNALARRWPLTDATLPCRHHPRSSDHFLNRLLLSGVRLAGRVAQNRGLRGALRDVGDRLAEEITPLPIITAGTFQRADRELNRLSESYRPAIELIHLLHDGTSLALTDDVATTVPGFLFDMNRFFQALVGKVLKEHLLEAIIEEEYRLTGMMRYVVNPRRHDAPTPRPDFLVTVGGKRYPLDAKYRDLWNLKLPPEMLYQLVMYAMSQPPPSTAAIIYPSTSAAATEAMIEIRDPATGSHRASVALRPLPILELEASLSRGEPNARRDDMVRALAFGSGQSRPERLGRAVAGA